MNSQSASLGGKRPQINIPVGRLHPDPQNPRLSPELKNKDEKDTLLALKKHFDLDELAYSISENGYFYEEPLIVIPQNLPEKLQVDKGGAYIDFINADDTHFIVVEGNRRVASVKILLSEELKKEFKIRKWPEMTPEITESLRSLPTIVYQERKEVLPYLGVRHIAGIKKWEAFSKAVYIAEMVDKGLTIDEIQRQVGDRSNSVRRIYFCYRLVEEVENEFEFDTTKAKDYFSYLLLSVGQVSIKNYLGIPKKWNDVDFKQPIDSEKLANLKDLFSWLFGEGKEKFPVIKESRDITNLLSPVLKNEESVSHLKATRDLKDAYDRSDGEKYLLIKNLRGARRNLENSLAIINRYLSEKDVIDQAKQCKGTLDAIFTLIEK